MYTAIEVANYIITYEHSQNRSISNLKLQKLLYFVQAQFIRVKDEPCFKDKIVAWSMGSVVLNVYYAYSWYGGMDILELKEGIEITITKKDKAIINEVLTLFADTPFYKLVDIIKHQTSYIHARRRIVFEENPEITIASIREFFKGVKIKYGKRNKITS